MSDLFCCACDERIAVDEDVYWEFSEDNDVMCDGCHVSTNAGGKRVDPRPLPCIDHGIVGCGDCDHWQRDRDDSDDRHAAEVSALRDELRIARFDVSAAVGERDMAVAAARSEAERETVQRVVAWLREQASAGEPMSDERERAAVEAEDAIFVGLAAAIDRKFGGKDKRGQDGD